MAIIRIIALLLLVGAGVVLGVQNQGLLSVTVLGMTLPLLPLGSLLLLSIALGLVIGILLLYLLQSRPRRSGTARGARRSWKNGTAGNPFAFNPFQGNPFQVKKKHTKTSRPKTSKAEPNAGFSRRSGRAAHSDWYDTPAQDWVDSAPPKKTQGSPPDPADLYEEDPDFYPRPAYPSPSSEGFEEGFERSKKDPISDRVVDADYRVLKHPNRPPPSDDEWEDEFFENTFDTKFENNR